MKILAVIQARGGSKGIPKKNIYPLNGYPLISYSIAAAKNSELISDVIVSTDASDIAETAKEYGAQVPFIRPAELAGDKVLSVDSLHHAVIETERILDKKYEFIIELPCVSPLRDHQDIDEALKKLIDSSADSVISMVDTGEKHPVRLKRIENDFIKDFTKEFPEPNQNSRRQDLFPPSYIRNGAIYAMKKEVLIEKKSRHGENSLAYVMSDKKSVNIDTLEDLKIAEFKIKNGECNNNPWQVKVPKIETILKKDKKTLLVTTPLHFIPSIKDEIENHFSVIYAPSVGEMQLKELLKNFKPEGWICSPTPKYKIDKNIMSNSENLKILVTPSTGSNHVNVDDCEKLNISFSSLKGSSFVNSIYASSEFCFALILSVVRKLPQANNGAKSFKWREAEDDYRGEELNGKTLGIIGMGRIGTNVANYAKAMNMKICAYDPNMKISKDIEAHDNYQNVLKKSDIVLISVHLDDSTENMVNEEWFELMKTGCYFINISRGEIVVEDALIKALEENKVKAAGLDVLRDEISTNIKESKILNYSKNHENLVITPHIAGLTVDSELKAAKQSLATIMDFFDIKVKS